MTKINDSLSKLSDLRLSSEAKSRIRAGLSTYADFHTYTPGQGRRVRSPFFASSFQLFVARGAAFALIVVMTGATTQASSSALPGDVLYPVKTHVAEPVRTAFIPSAKGKASWQAELAERRLEEAAALAVMQKLDPETEQELAADFESHVEQSLSAAQELEQEGDLGTSLAVRSKLEARVTAHENILATVVDRLATTTETDTAPAASLLKVVAQIQDTVETERMVTEIELAGTTTVDVAIASAPADAPADPAAATMIAPVPDSPAAEQIAQVSAERESDIAAIIEENTALIGSLPVPVDTGTTTPAVATTTDSVIELPETPDIPAAAPPAPVPTMNSAPAQKMNFFRSR